MILHKPISKGPGFLPVRGGKTEYEVSGRNVGLGILLMLFLIGGAFGAKVIQWNDGSSTLLHMAEVLFGGLAGLLFGERGGLQANEK